MALVAVIILSVWKLVGYNMIILLVGMRAVPREYHEAAAVDGANGWRQFRHITLPLLRPVTLFVIVITTISAYNVFTQVYVLASDVQGQPGRLVRVLVYDIFENGFRFFKQWNEYGMKLPVVGGMTAFDEVAVRNMGDYAIGSLSSCWYTAQLDNPINRRFVATYVKDNGYDPGQYASGTYLYGEVLAAAIAALNGKIEDKNAFIKALRAVRVETLRGPIAFDDFGNVVGNIYIRKVERKGGRLVNTNIHTYPNVSQFWTYEPKQFLKQPVYSRDWPPMKTS